MPGKEAKEKRKEREGYKSYELHVTFQLNK